MSVYLFWLFVSTLFKPIKFEEDFKESMSDSLNRAHMKIYFGYMIKLNRLIMDRI